MSAADELRALTAAATPGPWETRTDADGFADIGALDAVSDEDWGTLVVGRDPEWGTDTADAELIVWLRNHADALADLIAAARAVETAQFSSRPGDLVRAVMGLSDPLTALEAR